ncbi:sigma 54-interacting transcriptional regulator [Paraglaciecola arctica]|uniref:sigma 54-interacting transcriptional regulator n=1 Tax=Paraglaciecola arctica TaxID=1128911 RepID=UPI001C0653D3|nr:sigma 54-interacting transcriptional regulator [Paraglaciecola arctica]MBU3003656.1 sigma 54-interacting transcriptional regulator [Paraglaciecola arctica]
MIKQTPDFPAAIEDIEVVLLYVEEPTNPMIEELLQQLASPKFKVEAITLTAELMRSALQQSLPLLMVCQNLDHALALTSKFELADCNLFWLPADTQGWQVNRLPDKHQVVDWQAFGVIELLLQLLQQQTQAIQDKLYAQHKLALLSNCLGDLSLTLSPQGNIVDINPKLSDLLQNHGVAAIGQNWLESLHIPSSTAQNRMQQILADLKHTHAMTRLPPFPIQLDNTVMMVDGFVGPLPRDESLLILRQVASWQSHEWLEQLNQQATAVTLLLINPDDFSDFNRSHGRDVGDQVLTEIIQSIAKVLRNDDFASRFSGAVFAVHLPDTNEQQGQILATRMLQMLRTQSFSKNKVKLEFSLGLATLEAEEQLGEQSPLELFRRANTALQAARSVGGGKLVSWQPQFDANILANLDRMSGKFSEAPNDDFRLMNLQWDIIRLIGNTHSLQAFSSQVCQLLNSGLQSEFVGLYLPQGDNLTHLASSTANAKVAVQEIHSRIQNSISLHTLDSFETQTNTTLLSYQNVIIPLITREQCLAILVVCWQPEVNHEVHKSSEQLEQISPNLAAALERIVLLEQEKNRSTTAEKVNGDGHELIFKSAAMRTLMHQVQLVAPTDASVLITGESGTGKEVIAEQLHNLSLHPDKPFITLDCSTIVGHLIESELFGHRKGAFTGAINNQPGKIAQADGGTLFLDEVGELPLDIQSKLLRFVQEKTYIAVGDQRVRKVDVRLILATNRNLPEEVAAGRFRADLYHRINVFTLSLPTLNQRGDDPLLLCRHFLRKFSQQYKKDISDFSETALFKLQSYTWPGNVRELKNCMMRAVILCSGHYIETEHLVLQQDTSSNSYLPSPSTNPVVVESDISSRSTLSPDDSEQITNLLVKLVDFAKQQTELFSVGDWLEKQWLARCLTKWGSLYQVAQHLNQSESTIRRRFAKLDIQVFEMPQLQPLTDDCTRLFDTILHNQTHSTFWQTIETSLHSTVLQLDISQQHKAKLLNVTQPTLRKIIQKVQLSV